MFPFDLPLEVSLSVFVVIIFSLYALIIMKFAPSETTTKVDERSRSTDKPVVRSDVPPTHAVNPASKKAKSGRAFSASKTNKNGLTADRSNMAEKPVDDAHRGQMDKDKQKKSFLLFGETNFDGCRHDFKFLSTLPKSTPIPEDCFGCPDILECISGKNKSVVSSSEIIVAP